MSIGKIYKINIPDNYFYYGSTCRKKLKYRLSEHKYNSKIKPNIKLYKHINQIGWDNINIELIEEIKYDDIKNLREIENEYIKQHIENPFCLNEIYPILNLIKQKENKKIYDYEHKEKISERKRKYYLQNKEKIIENTLNRKKKIKDQKQILNININNSSNVNFTINK